MSKQPLSFEEWIKQNELQSYEEIKKRVFAEGGNQSDVDAEMNQLRHSHEEYVEENN